MAKNNPTPPKKESHEEALADPEKYGVNMPSVDELLAWYKKEGKTPPPHLKPSKT